MLVHKVPERGRVERSSDKNKERITETVTLRELRYPSEHRSFLYERSEKEKPVVQTNTAVMLNNNTPES